MAGLAIGAALDALAAHGPGGAVERGLAAAAAAGVVAVHEHSLPGARVAGGPRRAAGADGRRTTSGVPLVVGYRAELCETTDDARDVLAEIPGPDGDRRDLAVDGTLAAGARRCGRPTPTTRATAASSLLAAEQIANHVAAVTRAARPGRPAACTATAAMAEALARVPRGQRRRGHAAAARGRAPARRRGAGRRGGAGHDGAAGPARRAAARGGRPAARGRPLHASGPLRVGSVLPVADLAGAGVPLALGSGVGGFDPWAAVRAAVLHPEVEQRVSARAAFRAHTRGGWRLAGLDHAGAGEIRIGAPAHLAIWRAEELVVQAPEGRLATWSTDPRAGTPLLPALAPDLPAPRCLRTLRAGHVIHDAMG